jgi:hypothetical protein
MSIGVMKDVRVEDEGSTRHTYTRLCEGLEHPKPSLFFVFIMKR